MDTLTRLLERLEAQSSWPPAATWTSAHFEELGDDIHVATGIRLSVATLKRVWGRVKYTSSPSRTTLDALAQYAGYSGWVDAEAALGNHAQTPEGSAEQPQNASGAVPRRDPPRRPFPRIPTPVLGILGALLGVVLVASLSTYLPSYDGPPAEVLRFESEQVNEGFPATVQFRYTVNGGAYDSMQVQQSWDERLRHVVDPGRGFYACTYYYPGVYDAKLLLDTDVVAQRTLVVPSDGWLATVDRPDRAAPLYLRDAALAAEGSLARISRRSLAAYGLDTVDLRSAIHRIDGFADVDTRPGFTLTTRFRNTLPAACALTALMLFGDSSTVVLPFGKTGCSGEFTLFAGGELYGGDAVDLSGFGVSGTGACVAEVSVRDRTLVVHNGGVEAFRQTMATPFGRLLGVRWHFEGIGAVDELRVDPL